MASKRAAAAADDRDEDARRTQGQWQRLDVPSLRLKCNAYNITATGKKDQLVHRLCQYFQSSSESAVSSADEEADTNSPSPTFSRSPTPADDETDHEVGEEDIQEMQALLACESEDGFSSEEEETNTGQRKTQKTKRRESTQSEATTNRPINAASDGKNMAPTSQQHNDDAALFPNQDGRPSQSEWALITAETKAMRSEVRQMKAQLHEYKSQVEQQNKGEQHQNSDRGRGTGGRTRKRPSSRQKRTHNSSPPHKQSRHQKPSQKTSQKHKPTYTQTSHAAHDQYHQLTGKNNANQNELQYQQDLQAAIQTSQQQQQQQLMVPTAPSASAVQPTGMSMFIPHTDPWASFRNPFTPPALKESELKKIEERKFVDFSDLLPENQATDISLHSDRPVIDIDESTGVLTHKDHRLKKARVTSFHRWSTAWCLFSQAHLHYHPYDYFELFKYHAIMVQHVNKYKFEACFKYDRDFRLTIQSERNMPPLEKTCHWSRESEDLRNKHLINNPLPICEKCKTPGHSEKTCRVKTKDTDNTNSIASVLSQQILPYAQQLGQQYHSAPTTTTNQPWKPNNHNFRPSQQNNPSRGKTPPNKKYCWRYAQGTPCSKPPCMFLHSCEFCGEKHGSQFCNQNSSTNFIPLSGP